MIKKNNVKTFLKKFYFISTCYLFILTLPRRIKYYIENEDERLKIASNGCSTYIDKYNPDQMWTRILKLINF